ncbi:MAG TPA: Uma2 family endonuclease [Planctomycetota bacterium]|nr:Uma2 family endonuclease [Planctomycetota bacterium]
MTTSPRVPVLNAGDKLTRDEFERRYAAMPDLKKAELIEGVVYMGSPVSLLRHGQPHHVLSTWLGIYLMETPGLLSGDNSTLLLDLDNEAQPDLLLCLPAAIGGRSRITANGYLEGPPELVIEVAASSVSYDLHQKLGTYRRNGVAEYLVHRVDDAEVDWFLLDCGVYVRQQPTADGILKSRQFPGLWLDVPALLRGDLRALREAIERGLADPAHASFVQRLTAS